MSAVPKHPMTADEFMAWTMRQPDGVRYELVAGEVVGMAPERAIHNLTKANVLVELRRATRQAGAGCQVFTDGMSVRIDAGTVYEPDAMVRCGDRVDPTATEVGDPLIVVEVVSPSSVRIDGGAKLTDYARLPSLRHYLIVEAGRRTVIHHAHREDGLIETSILRSGPLVLDPPGVEVIVESFFDD